MSVSLYVSLLAVVPLFFAHNVCCERMAGAIGHYVPVVVFFVLSSRRDLIDD